MHSMIFNLSKPMIRVIFGFVKFEESHYLYPHFFSIFFLLLLLGLSSLDWLFGCVFSFLFFFCVGSYSSSCCLLHFNDVFWVVFLLCFFMSLVLLRQIWRCGKEIINIYNEVLVVVVLSALRILKRKGDECILCIIGFRYLILNLDASFNRLRKGTEKKTENFRFYSIQVFRIRKFDHG